MNEPKPLAQRSLHEIRGIAQAIGVTDIFEKDAIRLVQDIELKRNRLPASAMPAIPKPEYDARLMTKAPAKRSTVTEIVDLLEPFILRGLNLSFDENAERWYMASGKKTDEGTLRMPLRHVWACAERVMK